MKWLSIILLLVVTSSGKEEESKPSPSKGLTDEERKFIKEIEAKFGIESDVSNTEEEISENLKENLVPSLPAVIAIEIINDTDSKSKGKRTIDANLGYGYRTDGGYRFNYIGKTQDKGKFMIYPYSQHDIPPMKHNYYSSNAPSYSQKTSKIKTSIVEIQPSRAFELIPVNTENNSGHKLSNSYNSYSVPSHTQSDSYNTLSTLYTTYNGHQFSGLQDQFPTVNSNYLVDSSQLLKQPQYKSTGITEEQLLSHGTKADHQVVPVLVLRIPSSYLKHPSAELYSSAPNNYPLSHYLQSSNLQSLVDKYFKQIGYSHGPQITPGHETHDQAEVHSNSLASVPLTDIRHQNTYPESQYSDNQSNLAQPEYSYETQHPVDNTQQYDTYQNTYSTQTDEHSIESQHSAEEETLKYYEPSTYTDSNVNHYKQGSELDTSGTKTKPVEEYLPSPYYSQINVEHNQYVPSNQNLNYDSQSQLSGNNYSNNIPEHSHKMNAYTSSDSNVHLPETVVLSENYPSNDHTHAQPYKPKSYKNHKVNSQITSFVTPIPHSSYKPENNYEPSPQNNGENVVYIGNSHAYPTSHHRGTDNFQHHSEYNPEMEYSIPHGYVPPVGSQKPPSFPKNHHSHYKRLVRNDKSETNRSKKQHRARGSTKQSKSNSATIKNIHE